MLEGTTQGTRQGWELWALLAFVGLVIAGLIAWLYGATAQAMRDGVASAEELARKKREVTSLGIRLQRSSCTLRRLLKALSEQRAYIYGLSDTGSLAAAAEAESALGDSSDCVITLGSAPGSASARPGGPRKPR